MIRRTYINNQVLSIYCNLDSLSFPIDPRKVIKLIPNCKYMSYQKMARLNNTSIEEIIQLCESKSGCTHYDMASQRYLILCNQSYNENNNEGRQRWTCSHEIGHIICNHHVLSAYDKLAENSLLHISNKEYEAEADFFAGSLLAPFPLFDLLQIRSPIDAQKVFGLSSEAALYRFKQYLRWRSTKIKTAWENDMVRIFKQQAMKA